MTDQQQNPLAGIYPALITPFTESGEVDEGKLRAYVQYLERTGEVDGLFVTGSYGSSPIMRTDQRKKVAEVVAESSGSLKIILHVGSPNPEETHELARHGSELNVDALAAITPFYYRHLEADVEQAFTDLIEAVDTPVLLYNNPKYTNFETSPTLLKRLADKGLAGIKDSSGNISTFYAFMEAVDNEGFTFLIGSQTLLLPSLVMGGHGCVSGLSNAFPGLIKSVADSVAKGDIAGAADLQRRANKLRTLTGEGIPVPFYHAALPLLGMDIGHPRRPFVAPSEARQAEIRQALDELGLLPA